MKFGSRALCAFVALAAVEIGIPANAQSKLEPITVYGTLGYSNQEAGHFDLSAVTGRLGVRFGSYLGVEGELSVGVNRDSFTYSPPCTGQVCPLVIMLLQDKLKNSESLYAVGYLPITPDADLFVRAGYGVADYSTSKYFHSGFQEQAFKLGAGGQYFFDGTNGIRLDYTWDDITPKNLVGWDAGGVNVWSIAFTRRF